MLEPATSTVQTECAMWNIGEGGTQYALILKRVIKEKTLKVALEAKRGDEGGESFWKAHMLR